RAGPGVLLAAAHPVRERVVGRLVVQRRRGLIVPVAPRQAAVGRDHGALIGHYEDDLRIVGVDPDLLIVVTAWRTTHRGPVRPTVLAAPHDRGRGVDHLFVLRIN